MSWPKSNELARVFFDGSIPSAHPNGNDWLASIGVREPETVWVTGVWKSEYGEKTGGLFSPEKMFYFVHKIKLKRRFGIEKVSVKLRLPSQTWKKVQKRHPSRFHFRNSIRQLWKNEEPLDQSSCWQQPITSKINSPFGKPRTLPNGRSYFHTGVDFRARTGTPISAIADGLVVLSRESNVTGKTLMLYHGEGIHSQYMHMSHLKFEAGQFVKKGKVIGLSGATGRVEGPHLHWELHWKGRKVDPLLFLKTLHESSQQNCSQQKT